MYEHVLDKAGIRSGTSVLDCGRRVTRSQVWVVIPTRLAESGIPQAFASLTDLLPADARPSLKLSGTHALSAPGKLDEVLAAANLSTRSDDTADGAVGFQMSRPQSHPSSAGATTLAIRHSGQAAAEQASLPALGPFVGDRGRVTLPGWLRVVEAS